MNRVTFILLAIAVFIVGNVVTVLIASTIPDESISQVTNIALALLWGTVFGRTIVDLWDDRFGGNW